MGSSCVGNAALGEPAVSEIVGVGEAALGLPQISAANQWNRKSWV